MRPNAGESRPRYSFQCTVCSRSCQYFYYGVKCCEACKHFFRRSISLMKEYTCSNRGNCDISKGIKCKRCRLSMCIRVGMNARGVSGKKFGGPQMLEFVRGLKRNLVVETHKLEQSTQQNEPPPTTDCGGSSPTTTGPSNWADSNSPLITNNFAGFILLKYMLEVEQKVRRIRDSQTMVPEYFYGQCTSFETILDRNLNLLECSAKFSTQMPTAPPAQFLEDVQKFGPIYKRPPYLALDLLMVFEIGKTFSFFERLNSSDKIALCSNIAMPLFVLSNGFYSVQQNSDSFTTPMGFMPITLYENSYYKENPIVMKMAYKALNEATQPFIRAKLNIEEFVLVRAIIYAHMVSPGLSEQAQQNLFSEAEKYSSLLMKLLQINYGPEAGPRRYAELLMLVEFVFNSGAQHRQLLTYVSNVLDKHFTEVMPPVLAQVCTRGPVELHQLFP